MKGMKSIAVLCIETTFRRRTKPTFSPLLRTSNLKKKTYLAVDRRTEEIFNNKNKELGL
jgi:hypothetical protein